ncbi:MAG: imidazolonepropionase [bacterium]
MTESQDSPITADLLIKNASELATAVQNPHFAPGEFFQIENGALAALEGKIVAVGHTSEIEKQLKLSPQAAVIDATGQTITPGFVDCHTHPVFHGTREHEFEMRIAGKSYEEIARAGGGIRSSVRKVRAASRQQLFDEAILRLHRFLSLGTTTIEAKSGYGLTLKEELKILDVIHELKDAHVLDIVPTFLGAHEIPDEYRSNKSEYIDLVIQQMIPEVVKSNLAEFCDVFCESSVFNVNESRQILQAAKNAGLDLKIHADQLTRTGGTALAAELEAVSADHLEYSTEEDWHQMKTHRVVPVLLPGAVFFIGKDRYAPAREMLNAGLPVAVATDFNPGSCMSESMPFMLTLSCLKLGLRPHEALTAATYHAALAVNRGNLLGTLEVGKKADVVIWNCPNHKHLPYHFGVNLVSTVIKSGVVVWEN